MHHVKRACILSLLTVAMSLHADDLDTIGVTLLRKVDPSLGGNGIRVAQPEAPENVVGAFEVNPTLLNNHPTNLFTWISSSGTDTNFPNAVGSASFHASTVGNNFYDPSNGVAPNILHVDNYDAEFFVTNFVNNGLPISARIVNQSFIFSEADGSHSPTNEERSIDSTYDDYIAQYGVLFVSGAGNGGRVFPAATCYNGIGVGVFPGSSSFGTTTEGRSKPDIVSPGLGATSFSTPRVSGAAAVLMQAGLRGDGGSNTNSASDIRTIKALLLNGAVKPGDWTNGVITPLDARYGAGVLNVFNSWNQLKGAKRSFIESTSTNTGNPHPPGSNPGNVPVLTGWDFNLITNSAGHEKIYHYYFNLPGSNSYTLTTTLVWQRQTNATIAQLNDLNLFLFNAANSNLVMSSTSAVDNVEHIFVRSLPPGRYDLQVEKDSTVQFSTNETYALAFEFFNVALNISQTNNNAILTWPIAPDGFHVESTTNISPPVVWAPVGALVSVDTNTSQNILVVPITDASRFFRLQRP